MHPGARTNLMDLAGVPRKKSLRHASGRSALGAGITFALVARKKHVARRRKHTRTNKE